MLEERCEQRDDARTRYEQAARLAPDFQPVLRRLRVLYTENSQWELALQIGELEATTPMRPVERGAFQVEMGRIWLDRLGDPYVRSGADHDGRVGIEWGVYGLPESFIVDREGRIRYKHIGPIGPQDLEETIMPLIAKLRG